MAIDDPTRALSLILKIAAGSFRFFPRILGLLQEQQELAELSSLNSTCREAAYLNVALLFH